MLEKIVEELESNHCSSVIKGGSMKVYDNVILFLDNKATKVFQDEEKFPVNVNKESPMYKREGLYYDIYHFNGCTINVHRHFERRSGKMRIDIYGDKTGKIFDNLNKLIGVEI